MAKRAGVGARGGKATGRPTVCARARARARLRVRVCSAVATTTYCTRWEELLPPTRSTPPIAPPPSCKPSRVAERPDGACARRSIVPLCGRGGTESTASPVVVDVYVLSVGKAENDRISDFYPSDQRPTPLSTMCAPHPRWVWVLGIGEYGRWMS